MEQHDWPAEYAELTAADQRAPLAPAELDRLAVAAFVLGHDDEVSAYRERAHEAHLARGEIEAAIRSGFWLGFHLQQRGELARAAGWQARIERLIPDGKPQLTGLLTMANAALLMNSGDAAAALPLFEQNLGWATEPDAIVLASLGRGSCLAMLGRGVEALKAMDEAMVHVTGSRVGPEVTGLAYCSVIAFCMHMYDFRRAQEWTQALTGWCDDQPGLVPYRGTCLVHRAQILQLRGAWTEAVDAAEDACRRLSPGTVGSAWYQLAEVERHRGRLEAAERAYLTAAADGMDVQPGLALLRAWQGQTDAAIAGLDRALAEDAFSSNRPLLLAARVELAIERADRETARKAASELNELARADSPYLQALAAYSEGAVRVACGDPQGAIPLLRRAWGLWQRLEMPYEGARTRLLVGQACRALGDVDAEQMELDGARTVFERLGAIQQLTALDQLTRPFDGTGLTPREVEVLWVLATGATNRAIADQLFLSERTVARHISNIFAKLRVSSRAAATAWAYDHRLTSKSWEQISRMGRNDQSPPA
ncbi:helix-turn-helix transcriptional regulator [Kribbella kalugense]|uniref:Regulatory LuxR family protein n=1 Tax=Kribbella kalugense TaxID=2512221 RepID=A0A4V3G8H1_9ACTN|nr:LuxR family transcriptional regulator [Kribbella kalugense]TDW22874.1 regulatory LuxR family protein [Kribbella kalugense]